MVIYIASDHRGFKLKASLKDYLKNSGYEVVDLGNDHFDEVDDYPDFAAKLAKEVGSDTINRRGVLICGSGAGVDIVANKFKNIRSVLATTPDQAYLSRKDDDTNVLSLAADLLDETSAKQITTAWLQTPFSGEEKHLRRIRKIGEIEKSLGIH